MRTFLFSVVFLFPVAASAQLGLPMAPPALPPQPVSTANVDVTQEAVERAIGAAMAETRIAVEDSATIEVLDAIREGFAAEQASAPASTPEAAEGVSTPTVRTTAQTFPTLYEGYGFQGDGFPERTTITGTVVGAGSLRLCRQGRPPVSRWLHVRLSGMPEGVPPVHVTVAVQCDEWAAAHYLGRSVRIDAIKSAPEQEIRMARRDLPESDSPLYVTDRTRVVVE
ncbi:MAG: hypothetical protein AAGI52_12415 [Bacteroidota bacterium]